MSMLAFPLDEGEHVIVAREHDYTRMKVTLLIFGIISLPFLVGIFVLYGLFFNFTKRNPRGHVVTNRRLIAIPGEGVPESYPLASIADVFADRIKVRGAGVGGAIGAMIVAEQRRAQDKRSKLAPSYWKNAVGIVLTRHDRSFERVPCPVGCVDVGLALARALSQRQ